MYRESGLDLIYINRDIQLFECLVDKLELNSPNCANATRFWAGTLDCRLGMSKIVKLVP